MIRNTVCNIKLTGCFRKAKITRKFRTFNLQCPCSYVKNKVDTLLLNLEPHSSILTFLFLEFSIGLFLNDSVFWTNRLIEWFNPKKTLTVIVANYWCKDEACRNSHWKNICLVRTNTDKWSGTFTEKKNRRTENNCCMQVSKQHSIQIK